MEGMRRHGLIASLVVVALVLAGAGGWWWWQRDERAQDAAAEAALTAYAEAWAGKDVSSVTFTDPRAVTDFGTTTAGLRQATVALVPGEVAREGTTATAPMRVTWTLGPTVSWTYDVTVGLEEHAGGWAVATPAEGSWWHPDIKIGDRLTVAKVAATRGDLLDRGGAALMPMGAVYPVQLDPTRATTETAAALERITGEKTGTLTAQLDTAKRSGSQAPIAVITYRQQDFDQRREALDALQGVIYPKTEQPLTPTRGFGQPLLGGYGEVTKEIVERSKGRHAAGDRAGLSGLQGQYDSVLAGAPGVKVTTSTGKVLFETEATAGEDVQTTLEADVQSAAETALTSLGKTPGALVAIDVPTGEVVAAANTPGDGFNRALTGRYAPGSGFKVVTSYELLQRGITTATSKVACPKTITVDGKSFRNYEGETLGNPSFYGDFVHSCNTAFIALAAKLADDDLSTAAALLGVSDEWAGRVGVDGTFGASIPTTNGATDKAAASIGQGRNETSPLAMAVLAGSVARGSGIDPVLVKTAGATAPQPTSLDPSVVSTLRVMMRGVVTSGTAKVLARAPGGAVSGKTGTAEFGTQAPPQTHAWFIGYQGDLAFAVLVEEGKSGGSVAAPVAQRFLTELHTNG